MRTTIINTTSDNMIVGHCVSCEGLVRIPLYANRNATVRCPRCNADFKLAEVLHQAAPVLEVVEFEVVEIDKSRPSVDEAIPQPPDRQPGDKFVVSPILQKGAKRKRRRRRSRDRSNSEKKAVANGSSRNGSTARRRPTDPKVAEKKSEVLVEKIAEAQKSDSRTTDTSRSPKPKPRRPKPRTQAKSKSSGMEVVKVVLGAAVALPVAQMLIWWFAGTDPLNIAPTVSRFAPFVVPAEFQPELQKERQDFYDGSNDVN